MKTYYVYILATKRNGTLYVGMTSDLSGRIQQHKQGVMKGFTKKYNIDKLMYYEEHSEPYDALAREIRIKHWRRKWKIELIEKLNPEWIDLSNQLL